MYEIKLKAILLNLKIYIIDDILFKEFDILNNDE